MNKRMVLRNGYILNVSSISEERGRIITRGKFNKSLICVDPFEQFTDSYTGGQWIDDKYYTVAPRKYIRSYTLMGDIDE